MNRDEIEIELRRLGANQGDDGYRIVELPYGDWLVAFRWRGEDRNVAAFSTEAEACQFLEREIRRYARDGSFDRPRNRVELQTELRRLGLGDYFSRDEGVRIAEIPHGWWMVYYSERGEEKRRRPFATEAEALAYLLAEIRDDRD